MSDALVKVFGIAILGALVCVVLRKWNADISVVFRAAVGIALCICCIVLLSPIVDAVRDMSESQIGEQAFSSVSVLLRALFIAILSHICSTVCRDCGESSIAYYAELGGKIEIMIISLPLLKGILDMALDLLQFSE